MRKQLIKTLAFCAACGIVTAQAQTSGSSGYGSQPSDPSKPSNPSGSQGSGSGSIYGSQPGSSSATQPGSLSATGRTQQQNVRATDLMDANVVAQQGSTVGTISDVIINPQSGRVDFAIIELSSSAGATGAPGAPGSTPGGMTAGDKQVPVPWSLLKPQSASASATPGTSALGQQKTFVFSGDQTKLRNAPAFDESRWQSQNTSEWSQSVYSHYGVQPGSATGGSTSPGGRITPPGSSPGSSGSTPDSSGGSLDKSGSSSGAGSSSSSGSSDTDPGKSDK